MTSLSTVPETLADGGAAPATTGQYALAACRIRNFRNLEDVGFDPAPAGAVVVGSNGHGKSNLLEAVHYLTLFRSARSARDTELVRHGAGTFHLAARSVLTRNSEVLTTELSVGFESSGKRKRVAADGVETARVSDAFGSFPSTLLSTFDAELVTGSPALRRRFLDLMLAIVHPGYLAQLQRYRAALVRRNATLRRSGNLRLDEQQVAVWEAALGESGAFLRSARDRWVTGATGEFGRICSAIGEEGEARLEHVARSTDAAEGAAGLLAALEKNRQMDIRRGSTGVGPHRDDLRLTLDGKELRAFGSGGQQRTASIALRLLEAAAIRQSRNAWPVLLLDDPFAELDTRRVERIREMLHDEVEGQVILAVPRESEVPAEYTRLERWRVRSGMLERTAHV